MYSFSDLVSIFLSLACVTNICSGLVLKSLLAVADISALRRFRSINISRTSRRLKYRYRSASKIDLKGLGKELKGSKEDAQLTRTRLSSMFGAFVQNDALLLFRLYPS